MHDSTPPLSNKINAYLQIIQRLKILLDGADSNDPFRKIISNEIMICLERIREQAELVKNDITK